MENRVARHYPLKQRGLWGDKIRSRPDGYTFSGTQIAGFLPESEWSGFFMNMLSFDP